MPLHRRSETGQRTELARARRYRLSAHVAHGIHNRNASDDTVKPGCTGAGRSR